MAARVLHTNGYSGSEFRVTPDPATGFAQPNLSNEIHSLFQHDMFPNLSNAEWTSLAMPLRLATQMLYDQRTARWVTTVSDGRLFTLKDGKQDAEILLKKYVPDDYQDKSLMRAPRPGAGSTNTMGRRSRAILKRLKEAFAGITVLPATAAGDDPSGDHTTKSNTAVSKAALRDFPHLAGDNIARIELNYETTWDFLKHPQNDVQRLAFQWVLAQTLVHEMAHVLNISVHGWRPEDVFYDTNCLNESGLDLETALFGGVYHIFGLGNLTDYHTPDEWAMVSLEYPTQTWFDRYDTADPTVKRLVARWPLDDYIIMSRIPKMFVAEMFTNDFWDNQVPRMGDGPIQPAPLYSWVARSVKVDDVYKLESGQMTTVKVPDLVICSLGDPGFPPRVNTALQNIVNAQRGRHPGLP